MNKMYYKVYIYDSFDGFFIDIFMYRGIEL